MCLIAGNVEKAYSLVQTLMRAQCKHDASSFWLSLRQIDVIGVDCLQLDFVIEQRSEMLRLALCNLCRLCGF